MRRLTCPIVCVMLLVSDISAAADAPSAELALSFQPVQKDALVETPPKSEFGKCTVKVEREGKSSGWVVLGPVGQVLRRFVDTNGDNVVDQWRYYHQGLEVYRDLDTNFNNKVDASRWLNTAGSRWGHDANEDGRIEAWKSLSAEEATQEAIRAMAAADEKRLQAILLSTQDIRELGLEESIAKQLRESVADAGKKLRDTLSRSKVVQRGTKWQNFNSSGPPCVIPAEDGKAARDLTVYASAIAIVDTAGKPGFVQIGEMIRVGNTWKLTQIPQPMDGTEAQLTVHSVLLQPPTASAATAAGSGLSAKARELLAKLQELDRNAPSPTAARDTLARYNAARAELLGQLIAQADSDDEREQWTRQLADGLAAAVQTGAFPDGLAQLKTLEADTQKAAGKSPVVPYVLYRRLLADYYQQLQAAGADDREKVQTWWLENLQAFVKEHPKAEDAPEALWQLGITQEFTGQLDEARKWFGLLANEHAESSAGSRAAGALRRLDLDGKPLALSGPALNGKTINVSAYRGKVLLVAFWATWCKPCTEDLPQLAELYKQHRSQGFEIVGVNLDTNADPIAGYLSQHQVAWPHIHQPGGLTESPPAKQFGIISLPTMFLVDKQGNVVHRNASVDDVKKKLPELLK